MERIWNAGPGENSGSDRRPQPHVGKRGARAIVHWNLSQLSIAKPAQVLAKTLICTLHLLMAGHAVLQGKSE